MRILIIDDNPVIRSIIKDIVTRHGHQVVAEAEDLKQGLAAYEKHRPDLVTLDLVLTGEDGLAVLRSIRKLDRHARILVVSSNVQIMTRAELRAAGVTAFLSKPFEMDELLDAVRQAGS